jgi:uncharacterized membrane protein
LGAAGSQWTEAIGGAAFAAVALVMFAFLFRTPLNQVSVMPMKFVAAMLLMEFGCYWLSEGLFGSRSKILGDGDDAKFS